jgi:hypothetical protein
MSFNEALIPVESSPVVIPTCFGSGELHKETSANMYWLANGESDIAAPDHLLQLGLGNEGRYAAQAVRQLANIGVYNVAVLEALPYWEVNPSTKDMTEFATQGAVLSAEAFAERWDVPHKIDESQASPGGLWAVRRSPKLVKSEAQLHPLGVIDMSVLDFGTGMAKSALQPDQFLDKTARQVGRRAGWRAAQDAWKNRGAQLQFAFGINTIATLQEITGDNPDLVTFFLNRSDRLFAEKKARDVLGKAGLGHLVHTIEGSHSSPASKAGARQIQRVVAYNQHREEQLRIAESARVAENEQ